MAELETWNEWNMRTDTGGEAYKTDLEQHRAALHYCSEISTEERWPVERRMSLAQVSVTVS